MGGGGRVRGGGVENGSKTKLIGSTHGETKPVSASSSSSSSAPVPSSCALLNYE